MSCLTDYIGLRICDTDIESDSGLYINSLPGISIEALDNIATSEQVTYMQVWEDAQAEAYALFETDFYDALLECHDVPRTCNWTSLICRNKKVLANAWRYLLGVQLMVFRLYTSRLNFFTLDDKEAADLRDLYQGEYEKALAKSVKLLDMSTVELPCNPKAINQVTWLP